MRNAVSICIAVVVAPLAAQDRAIDVGRSTMTVHAGKAGLFSIAGHEHWISAPLGAGVLNNSDKPHVEFTVRAAGLTVKPDPKVDSKTQAEIQNTMQEMVLESARYPEIVFRSSRVEPQAARTWKVEGLLTLHGVTRPVSAVVTQAGETYAGRTSIKQTDFGIRPISVAGGAVKVKNELDIEFQIVTRPE
ncbi:MAG: YceI family protein [Acidobacteriia bacterium]|nr:YceI family protein [Terriglobia bacterium]